MAGVAAVGLQGVRIAAEINAALLRTQHDAIELEGQLAVQLIQSAVITDSDVGGNLDVIV
jgi:hypothetical protein